MDEPRTGIIVLVASHLAGWEAVAGDLVGRDKEVVRLVIGDVPALSPSTSWHHVSVTQPTPDAIGRVLLQTGGPVVLDSLPEIAAMLAGQPQDWDDAVETLLDRLRAHAGNGVVVVAPPEVELTGPHAAATAALVRAIAAEADDVRVVMAGRTLALGAVEMPRTEPSADAEARTEGEEIEAEELAAAEEPVARTSDVSLEPLRDSDTIHLDDLAHRDRLPASVRHALSSVEPGRVADIDSAVTAVAMATGTSAANVVLAPSCVAIVWAALASLRPSHAAVVHPSSTQAEAALRSAGVAVTRVPRDGREAWALGPDRVPDDADLVVISNPNDPTGALDEPAVVAKLCRPGRTVLLDESLMDFVLDGRSSLAGRTDLDGLVVIRSLDNLWGLPGVGAAYAVASPDLAERLRTHQPPVPVTAHAVAALSTCLLEEAYRQDVAEGVARRRRAMARRLSRIPGVVVHEGAANFVLLEIESGPAVHRALLARGVAVQPSIYPLLGPRFLRATVRDPESVELLAQALESILVPS